MQGIIQKYIDSSISSTVNLKAEVQEETVADIYMTAYKSGLKGITVYREGSRQGILITEDDKEKPSAQATTPQTHSSTTIAQKKRKKTSNSTKYNDRNYSSNPNWRRLSLYYYK